MDGFLEFCREHRFTILFIVLGLLIAILFMTIGFWRTMLLVLVVGLFFLIGLLLDRNGPDGVKAFFNHLFSKKKE